jgi:sialic acid synthase SpsE
MASQKASEFVEGREPFVCAELGSCHLGDKDKLFELSEQCIKAGADGLKVQLFPNLPKYTATAANIVLPDKMFEEWVRAFHDKAFLGVTVFEYDYPRKEIAQKLSFLKIARSHAINMGAIERAKDVIARHPHLLLVGSFSYMDAFRPERFAYDVALYCHAINGVTVYPVETALDYMSILYNTKLDGLSDHSMSNAISIHDAFNTIWMEKHVMLNDTPRNSCGDAHFALDMTDFKMYVKTSKAGLR